MEDLYLSVPVGFINSLSGPIVPPSTPIGPRQLVRGIAERHGLTIDDLTGQSTAKRVVPARWEAMTALRNRGWSLTQIGNYLHRDHTTVLYGLRRHAGLPASQKSGH